VADGVTADVDDMRGVGAKRDGIALRHRVRSIPAMRRCIGCRGNDRRQPVTALIASFPPA
jgi:hypothetical protein